jgi:HNH endonuclease
MTSTLSSLRHLSDRDLLVQVTRAAAQERQATAQLVALLIEVDARKLYATQSCSSLFTYCVQVLHCSEHAAYLRIEAARAARRFPVILERLANGSLHLTAVSLLAPHLTIANHVGLLDAAHHKSKRDVEQLVARVRPQPDVAAVVRKLPAPGQMITPQRALPAEEREADGSPPAATGVPAPPLRPAEVKPLSPERFKVQFTVSRDTYDKLRQVQDLLRHSLPNGDPAAIFDRALTLLLADLSKTKFAAASRPRPGRKTRPDSRYVPAAVKREVWRRDGGRCAFRGEQGRCTETGFLEFHHVVPYAKGGAPTRENLELRCRTHNIYEAGQHFARATQPFLSRETRADYGIGPRARSGPSPIAKNALVDQSSAPSAATPRDDLPYGTCVNGPLQ